MDTPKENILKECRIGDTYFMPFATIGGNLFTRHSKNINHLHRYSNNILSMIIILGTESNGGETDFMMDII